MSDRFFRLYLAPERGAKMRSDLATRLAAMNRAQRFGYFDDDPDARKNDQFERIFALLESLDARDQARVVIYARVLSVQYVAGNQGSLERLVFDDVT